MMRANKARASHQDSSSESDSELVLPPAPHVKPESDLIVPVLRSRIDADLRNITDVPVAVLVDSLEDVHPTSWGIYSFGGFNHNGKLHIQIKKRSAESVLNYIKSTVGCLFQKQIFCSQTDLSINPQATLILFTDTNEDNYVWLRVNGGSITVLRIKPTTTDKQVHEVVESLTGGRRTSENTVFFSSSGRHITVQEMRSLPQWSIVCASTLVTVMWRICYRCTRNIEHYFTLEVINMASLLEVKQQFLNTFGSKLKMSPTASPDEIWFTHSGSVLTDEVLQELFDISFSWSSVETLNLIDQSLFVTTKARRPQMTGLSSLNVEVHFQPSDAIAISVVPNQMARRHIKQEFVIVVPRDVSTKQLRLEVSKAVRQQPGALKIKIGKTNIENLTDLQQKLCEPKCVIRFVIEPRQSIAVKVLYMPRYEVAEKKLKVYPYDTIADVRIMLGATLQVPVHRLDLKCRGNLLQDDMSIKKCQIGAEIEAIVYAKRINLILHVLSSKWVRDDVVVDDISAVTVQDLKQFARSLEPTFAECHDSEISAFFQNRILDCDQNTLLEVGISADAPNQRVVLKRINSLCFSASSVATSGVFITFQDSGAYSGSFKYTMTMTDRKMLFSASSVEVTQRDRRALLCKRKVTLDQRAPQGIRRCRRSPLHEDGSLTGCPHLSQRNVATDPHPRTTDAINTQVSPSRTSRETADKAVNKTKVCRVRFDTDVEGSRPLLLDKAGEASPECTVTTVQQSVNRLDSEKHSTPPQRRDAELTTEAIRTSPRSAETVPEDCQITVGTSGSSAKKRTVEKDLTISESPHSSSLILRHSGSEYDDGRKRRKLSRTTVTEESMEESEQEEGLWKVCTKTTSTYFVEGSAAESQQRNLMMASTSGEYGYPRETPNSHEVVEDSKYKHIDREIILAVARELGGSGEMVIRQLGVPDHIISAVEARHSKNIISFHLECLMIWCEMKTIHANPDNLKKALAKNDRNDLVELVNNHLSGKTAGYITS